MEVILSVGYNIKNARKIFKKCVFSSKQGNFIPLPNPPIKYESYRVPKWYKTIYFISLDVFIYLMQTIKIK